MELTCSYCNGKMIPGRVVHPWQRDRLPVGRHVIATALVRTRQQPGERREDIGFLGS